LSAVFGGWGKAMPGKDPVVKRRRHAATCSAHNLASCVRAWVEKKRKKQQVDGTVSEVAYTVETERLGA